MLFTSGTTVSWQAGLSINIVSSDSTQATISTNWGYINSIHWATPGSGGIYGDSLVCTADGVSHSMSILHSWPA